MANFNKVILIGNITREIELTYIPSGMAIVNNSLAINNTRVVDGVKKEDTTFVEFVTFGKQAETLSQYQQKGSNILIEGHLKLDTWDDKETGKKRSRLNVVADRIQFLGGKPDGQPQAQQFGAQPASPPYQPSPTVGQGVVQYTQPQGPVQQVTQPVQNQPAYQTGFVQPDTAIVNGQATNVHPAGTEVAEDDIPF